MDTSMAKVHVDYLEQVIELLKSNAQRQDMRMDKLEAKIDANTLTTNQTLEQARHTNGRVTRSEEAIRKLQRRGVARFGISPNLLYAVALCLVLLLAIIATLLKVDIGGLLG